MLASLACSANQAMYLLTGPDPAWRNEADCGFADFTFPAALGGAVVPLNCAGPNHIYFRDLDGSLLASGSVGVGAQSASRGTLVGYYGAARMMPYAQGTPVTPGPCTYSSTIDGYTCLMESDTYSAAGQNGLSLAYKPTPMPKYGVFGDPQLFVLESRDPDSEDRNFSPVFFNVSGVIDMVVTAMDQGWCFAYTCQKRLSTFWTYLPTWHVARVNFTGTPARVFRLWLPYAAPDDELIVVLNYLYTPDR